MHDGVENGSEICTVGTTRSRDQRSFDTEFLTERSMFAPLSQSQALRVPSNMCDRANLAQQAADL